MFKTIIALSVAAVTLTGVSAAFAADGKPAKPTVCEQFSTAKTDGGEIGICAARKAGGKPTMLRTFSIVTVNDPNTGKPARVMVGFR